MEEEFEFEHEVREDFPFQLEDILKETNLSLHKEEKNLLIEFMNIVYDPEVKYITGSKIYDVLVDFGLEDPNPINPRSKRERYRFHHDFFNLLYSKEGTPLRRNMIELAAKNLKKAVKAFSRTPMEQLAKRPSLYNVIIQKWMYTMFPAEPEPKKKEEPVYGILTDESHEKIRKEIFVLTDHIFHARNQDEKLTYQMALGNLIDQFAFAVQAQVDDVKDI